MPTAPVTAPVSEVVTRPSALPGATGSYTGVESIVQNGQTLNLDLSKFADLTVAPANGLPGGTIDWSQVLSVTITKTASAITAQFSLSVNASVLVTHADGTVNPFNSSLSIQGSVTFTPAYPSCHVDYRGHDCNAHLACDGSDGMPKGAMSLDSADTTFNFSDLGGDGFAALIISHNTVTSAISGSEAPDPASADEGAIALLFAASALERAFPGAHDPVQGVNHADADVLRAMGEAALNMIAHPGVQTVAVDSVVAATVAGAHLAIIDGLAAYDVAANPPGSILLG